jgi:hypothetical protein
MFTELSVLPQEIQETEVLDKREVSVTNVILILLSNTRKLLV